VGNTLVIPALERLKQEDLKFEASLVTWLKPVSKKKKKKKSLLSPLKLHLTVGRFFNLSRLVPSLKQIL
jgi:hypothetical protein